MRAATSAFFSSAVVGTAGCSSTGSPSSAAALELSSGSTQFPANTSSGGGGPVMRMSSTASRRRATYSAQNASRCFCNRETLMPTANVSTLPNTDSSVTLQLSYSAALNDTFLEFCRLIDLNEPLTFKQWLLQVAILTADVQVLKG